MTVPRRIETPDLDWVLALNQEHVTELSPLTAARLADLVVAARYARALDPQAGFLLAFDQDADYDSPNFLWFRETLDRFLYVDRVVVSAKQRGKGLARAFYEDLFRAAADLGHAAVVCEVNSDPPNPASDAFHAALGFAVVGEARLEARGKSVRFLRRDL